MAAEPKILIVGAGPCGLTAAIELARRGLHPRIIDRDPGPTPLSKAVGVSPHSLDLLEPAGVTERLLTAGVHVQTVQPHYENRRLSTLDISRLQHRFNFLLCLPQSETERVMEGVLNDLGVRVEWNAELSGLRLAGETAEVELQGAPGGTFDYVYGADGAKSGVREAAGIGFSGYVHKRLWSIADAEVPGWPFSPSTAIPSLHRNGDIGFIIPIGPGRFRTVSNTPDAMVQVPGVETAQVSQRDTFHIPVRQADTYQSGAVFLGGDAAHVHSPVGARGMNLGIEDAACFARRLANRTLEGYTAERHPVGNRWIVLSERILGAAQTENRLLIPIRNTALRMVGALPALRQAFVGRVSGLRQ